MADRSGTPRRMNPAPVNRLAGGLALALFVVPGSAGAQESGADRFEFYGRTVTNVQMFERALLPGPGGTSVSQQFMAPIHQSLSARAVGVDTPLGEDSLEIQIAAYGQGVPGADDAVQPGTFDVASAFVKQDFRDLSVSIGRQVTAGGAARYSRFDGGKVTLKTASGLELSGYGGLTALPRYNQQYGYHHLGDNYESWSTEAGASLTMDRAAQWMGGMRALFRSDAVGSLGFSFHQQAEDEDLYRSTLGLDGALVVIDDLELTADAQFSAESARFSDVRVAALVEAFKYASGELVLRGEFLHTVPSLFLSQSSVLSVFAFEEITEAGGEVSAGLPAGFSVDVSAYGQMYQEGEPGLRAEGGVRLVSDKDRTFFARSVVGRLSTRDNGYVMLRNSLSYRMTEHLSSLVDIYYYRYDEPISEIRSSTFYAGHLAYEWAKNWNGRIGASLTRSPYASADLQALARVEYQFETGGR